VTVTAIAAAGASTLEHDLVLLLWVQ